MEISRASVRRAALAPVELRFDAGPSFLMRLFVGNAIQIHLMPLIPGSTASRDPQTCRLSRALRRVILRRAASERSR